MNAMQSLKNNLAQVLNCLKDGAVERIDFDRMTEVLENARNVIGDGEKTIAEYGKLQQDYRRRLMGMLKAVMVGKSKEGDGELAAALADESREIPSRDLIELHRRISARFRDCFPASFGYVSRSCDSSRATKNWMDHKL